MAAGFTTMNTPQYRNVTAFFDHRRDADDAVNRLVAAGVSSEQIRMVEGNRPGTTASSTGSGSSYDSSRSSGGGFWDALADLFMPDEDRSTYAEGLSRGGYLVTVNASAANYDTVLDILDDEGTVDLDSRAESWRSEGWTGSSSRSMTDSTEAGFMASELDVPETGSGLSRTSSGYTGAATGSGYAGTDRLGTEGERIPLAKEELRVGKRDVSHGRVRVRSYVVEEPVETSVGLRSEHVEVERRPVDRTVESGTDLFRERTIEAEERAEEAVVSKNARVTEEVVLRKDVDQREKSISDTVRKTEVEIEDDRGTVRNDGTSRLGR